MDVSLRITGEKEKPQASTNAEDDNVQVVFPHENEQRVQRQQTNHTTYENIKSVISVRPPSHTSDAMFDNVPETWPTKNERKHKRTIIHTSPRPLARSQKQTSDGLLDVHVRTQFLDTWLDVHDDIRWFFMRDAQFVPYSLF